MNDTLGEVQIRLVDLNVELTEAWKQAFHDVPLVSVRQRSLFVEPADAIVREV